MKKTLLTLCCTVFLAITHGQWATLGDLPIPDFAGGYAFTLVDQVYVGHAEELYRYDEVGDSWTPRASFPGVGTDRTWASSFVINGKAYVGLGITTGNTFRQDLWEYNPVADSWTQKADLPGPSRGGASTFVVNGIAYVCGGTDDQNTTYSDVYAYDPSADSWSLASTLPTGNRGFTTAFSIGGKGYVYGGYFGFGNETQQLHEYDPVADSWTQKADFPGGGRQSAVGFVVNDIAVVGLGNTGFITSYNDLYAYDPSTDIWAVADDFPGGQRFDAVVAVLNGTAYLGSGTNSSFAQFNDWYSWTGAVGVEENGIMQLLNIYPNPSSDGTIIIDRKSSTYATVEVLDGTGRLVHGQSLAPNVRSLDLGHLEAGSYSISLQEKESKSIAIAVIQ